MRACPVSARIGLVKSQIRMCACAGAAVGFTGTVTVSKVALATGAVEVVALLPVALAPGPGVVQLFNIDGTIGERGLFAATMACW